MFSFKLLNSDIYKTYYRHYLVRASERLSFQSRGKWACVCVPGTKYNIYLLSSFSFWFSRDAIVVLQLKRGENSFFLSTRFKETSFSLLTTTWQYYWWFEFSIAYWEYLASSTVQRSNWESISILRTQDLWEKKGGGGEKLICQSCISFWGRTLCFQMPPEYTWLCHRSRKHSMSTAKFLNSIFPPQTYFPFNSSSY